MVLEWLMRLIIGKVTRNLKGDGTMKCKIKGFCWIFEGNVTRRPQAPHFQSTCTVTVELIPVATIIMAENREENSKISEAF
jgi:hypothetical protein